VKDSASEVVNIKMGSETPKELVAVGQIKLVSLQIVAGKIENVPLVNKMGQQVGQINFETSWAN
jgi:hypothetical protein